MNRAAGDSNPRGIAVDRVQFIDGSNLGIKAEDYGITTESGTFDALYTNGATWSLQPLMESVSGYENIAPEASVTATNADSETIKYLNDGIFANHYYSAHMETVVKEKTEITLEFSQPKDVRAIMIYNSFEYLYAFSMIDKIEFTLAEKKDGKKRCGHQKPCVQQRLLQQRRYVYAAGRLLSCGVRTDKRYKN